MKWELVFTRTSTNRLNDDVIRRSLKQIAAVASRNQSLGFVGKVRRPGAPVKEFDPTEKAEKWRYTAAVQVQKPNGRSDEVANRQFEHVSAQLTKKAQSKGWQLMGAAGAVAAAGDSSAQGVAPPPPRTPFVPPALTDEVYAQFFGGIYERGEHIRLIHDATVDYVDSLRDEATVTRPHTLLKGPPAGCKTTLFERFKTWYERDGQERVLFVDATTTSKAGLENWLLDRAESKTLPEVLVFEEIEKQSMDNLLTLISLMSSGYIAKLNARVGFRKELANVLVWATCNQEQLIREFRNGVLWSRFANRLHCVRPSRELMARILLDKIRLRNGNPRWADAALNFAYETVPAETGKALDDPREIVALLSGRDRLLDGTAQQDRLKILRAERGEARLTSG